MFFYLGVLKERFHCACFLFRVWSYNSLQPGSRDFALIPPTGTSITITCSPPFSNLFPVESTSASTGAAHKLIHGSDSEELPPVELPDTVQLPTPGVEYSSLTVTRLKQLMDSVMTLVFHRIKQ